MPVMIETQAKEPEDYFFFFLIFFFLLIMVVLVALLFCAVGSQNSTIKHLVILAWNIICYFLYYFTSLPCVPPC